eukprot:1153607-Pelagomonas_calceolata.AAC.2
MEAGELEPRYEQLRSAFSKTFNAEPECFARAPGAPVHSQQIHLSFWEPCIQEDSRNIRQF